MGASEAPVSGWGARSTPRAGAATPESGSEREEDMDGRRSEAGAEGGKANSTGLDKQTSLGFARVRGVGFWKVSGYL